MTTYSSQLLLVMQSNHGNSDFKMQQALRCNLQGLMDLNIFHIHAHTLIIFHASFFFSISLFNGYVNKLLINIEILDYVIINK